MQLSKDVAKRRDLQQEVERLKAELIQKKKKNEETAIQMKKLTHEANREEGFLRKLDSGLKQMMREYCSQFQELDQMVLHNNEILEELRKEKA